jgi:TRAP-type C4-dicarboxylate transport system substrate-binding protein
MVESWGAEPVGMPVPSLPQALSKKTIDGALIPFEVAIPLKIAELTDFSVEMHGGERFGTATFMFAMNKNSFNSLPDDLKKIIDDNSGAAIASAIGEAWNNIEPIGKKIATDKGKRVSQLSAAESAKFSAASARVIDRWIGEVKGNSIDGRGLVTRAQAAIAKHSK